MRIIRLAVLELIKGDVAFGDSEVGEHFRAGFDHHRRAAEVVFDRFRVGVLAQIFFQHDLVDEAGVAGPVVLGERR